MAAAVEVPLKGPSHLSNALPTPLGLFTHQYSFQGDTTTPVMAAAVVRAVPGPRSH